MTFHPARASGARAGTFTSVKRGSVEQRCDRLGEHLELFCGCLHCECTASQTTTYAYSTLTAVGKVGFQQVMVTDPEGKATVFVSNLAGQRTAMVDPNAGATAYVYDGNGQTTSVSSPAGTITMGYDVLGRMVSRSTGGSSSATWDYVDPGESGAATDLGLLRASTSKTHTSLGDLTTVTSAVYDSLHRPVSSTTKLPASPAGAPNLLGDLSGKSYTTTAGYDALGQPTTSGLPATGGLPAETMTTGLRKSGSAEKLTLTSAGKVTPLVKGVSYSGTGQMLSRTYGNGVTRNYGWDPVTRALTGLSASFVTSQSGSAQTVFVQKDSFTRDVMGRVIKSTNEVPVSDGTAAAGKVTAECFTYDGFNRLSGAWTVAGSGAATCGTAAPANATATGWDASKTAYAAQWSYSTGGRITSLVKGAAGAPTTSTYTYTDTAHPAAVTQVTGGTTTDSFGYDTSGRMVSRTVGGVATALTWDVTSSLVESNGQGGRVVYAYDASGQRVVQARVADANGVGTATGYVASGQVDDPNTASTSTGDITATRYYTFGGSTVAVRTNDGKLSLMLGDEQGSTNVMMPVHVVADGNGTSAHLAPATLADALAVTRTSYTPYGQLRGADNLATDRGWLGQVEDRVVGTGATSTGTGLTYLNARYYDPATSRFISPDPLMNPGDPKTLDPYRYADNNPVVFTDATGLMSCGSWWGRFGWGFLGSSCGGSPDSATHAGAGAAGVADGTQQYTDDQLRVFTADGALQAAGDIGRYGPAVTNVWALQSAVNTSENLADASTATFNAVQYNDPGSTRAATAAATPVVLDGARNYVSIMYAGAGVSFEGLGPASTAVRVSPVSTRIAELAPQRRGLGQVLADSKFLGRDSRLFGNKSLGDTSLPPGIFNNKNEPKVLPILRKPITAGWSLKPTPAGTPGMMEVFRIKSPIIGWSPMNKIDVFVGYRLVGMHRYLR